MKLNRKTRWVKVRRQRIAMCRRFSSSWAKKYREAKAGLYPEVIIRMVSKRLAFWTFQTFNAISSKQTPYKKSSYDVSRIIREEAS